MRAENIRPGMQVRIFNEYITPELDNSPQELKDRNRLVESFIRGAIGTVQEIYTNQPDTDWIRVRFTADIIVGKANLLGILEEDQSWWFMPEVLTILSSKPINNSQKAHIGSLVNNLKNIGL